MTLQEIYNKMLLRRQGNTTADANYQLLINEWADEALKEIWNGKGLDFSPNWWFLQVTFTFSTLADQMTYDLPSDIDTRKVFSLRQKEDDVKCEFVDQRVVDEVFPDPSITSGNPFHYTIYGRDVTSKKPYIRLIPIPDSVITMYIRYYQDMDSYDPNDTGSTVILPDKYDTILMDGILYKWYERDPERGNASEKKAEFIQGIEG